MPSVYLNETLSQVPRLLSLLDRNPSTDTYGCFDREYWHYNTTDTPCARKQEAMLSLALLYKIKHKNNPYYKNPKILEWINASLDFWTKIECKDGSFNEWYPNEHSFVATAFSSYAVSETLLIMGGKIKNRNTAIYALKKAGDWLLGKYESRVQNQQAGAALSLLNIYLLTKESKYLKDAEKKINNLIKNQTEEGWWLEYGGPDIGYLSLTIDYLVKYYRKHPSNSLRKVIRKAIHFISYFMHPDLTSGGCYASRNTEYLIPSGFEAMSDLEEAASISSFIRDSIKKGKTINLSSLDDRYLSYIGYNWLQAFLNAKKIKEKKQLFENNFTKDFKIAKIYIKSTPYFYFILNYNKGTFKVFLKKTKNNYTDSGLLLEKNKKVYIIGLAGSIKKFLSKDNKLILEGKLRKLSKNVLTPYKNIGLRLFQTIVGKSEKMSLTVKNKLRDRLITKSESTNMDFSRCIYLNRNSIKIVDKIKNIDLFKRIIVGDKFSYLFVPSANYFQKSELDLKPLIIKPMKKGSIEIIRNLI